MPYAFKETRRAYDKARNARPAIVEQKKLCNRVARKREPTIRPFVAIDSEGGSSGVEHEHNGRVFQTHKTFLWGAGDQDGETDWLYSGKPLGSAEICNWLLSLPKLFGPSIFVSFAFGYDVAQCLAGLPYAKAWEIQHEKPFDQTKENIAQGRRITRWRQYGFQYLKGKIFTIYEFNEGPQYVQRGATRKLNIKRKIRIFDVFGFFQSSFVHAIKAMPGAATEAELERITAGKKERAFFDLSKIDYIKDYTTAELRVLARMMTLLRNAMVEENIAVKSWHGAGAIAQALMQREGVKHSLQAVASSDLQRPQVWAHHAYFGGRIELIQQGSTSNKLYGYDIASAYPAAAALLPGMDGGYWIFHDAPSLAQLTKASPLSMVHLYTNGLKRDVPFYPLPYRMPSGGILFPEWVNGYYMRDEALAAFKWKEVLSPDDGAIQMRGLWEFIPAGSPLPFHFLRELFDYRASLKKTDIRGQVVKLGINACYGKLATRVGSLGQTPALASPWHAAAITAWTRARIMDAALTDPGAIVMFATDGIVSTRKLNIKIPEQKTLGEWEFDELPEGGVFIQSGVYAISGKKGWTGKSRGFRPNNLDKSVTDVLRFDIPKLWADDARSYPFSYTSYMTLGASLASETLWRYCGTWARGTRELDIYNAGNKRTVTHLIGERRKRASKLVPTFPSNANSLLCDEFGELSLSCPASPDWLGDDLSLLSKADEDEQEAILARFE